MDVRSQTRYHFVYGPRTLAMVGTAGIDPAAASACLAGLMGMLDAGLGSAVSVLKSAKSIGYYIISRSVNSVSLFLF